MSRLYVRTAAKTALRSAALLAVCLPGQAQSRAAAPSPALIGPLSNPGSALVSYNLRQPDGRMTLIKLRRLPASCVVRDGAPSAPFTQRVAQTKTRGAALEAPAGLSPQPALLSDPQLYNSELDYSHDNTADTGWIFPTRGYDLRNSPGGFRLSLNSLIYPTDPSYVGTDSKTHSYDNFNAPVELLQLGQSAQISTMRISMGVAREVKGATAPTMNLNPAGGTAVILFWDGVYNDLVNGFARDNTGAYKLAQDSVGSNGVLVQLGQGFGEYTINFDNDGSGAAGRFFITDPKGRMGLTVAAVYDPTAGTVDGTPTGEPYSTREDGVYLRPGASVGQNKYYLISHGNVNVGTPTYDGNGVSTTTSGFDFVPGDSQGNIYFNTSTQNVDGSVTYQVAPADMNFNPGEGLPVTANGQTRIVPVYAPLNSSVVLYGTNLNGSHAKRGELRGRIRQQGVEPDNNFNPTKVVSPYDPTPATPSLPKVPGESKMNRFRFTFISPTIGSDVNIKHAVAARLRSCLRVIRSSSRKFTPCPPTGTMSDYAPGTTQHGTTLKYNYRLRGIPAGTYSVLVQAIPDCGHRADGGRHSHAADGYEHALYNVYPGSDYAAYIRL